jgi:hypothetical protein
MEVQINAKKKPGSGHGRLQYCLKVEEVSSRFGFQPTLRLFKNVLADFAEEIFKRCYGKNRYTLVLNYFNFCYYNLLNFFLCQFLKLEFLIKSRSRQMPGVLPLPAPLPLSDIEIDPPSYGVPRTARAAE